LDAAGLGGVAEGLALLGGGSLAAGGPLEALVLEALALLLGQVAEEAPDRAASHRKLDATGLGGVAEGLALLGAGPLAAGGPLESLVFQALTLLGGEAAAAGGLLGVGGLRADGRCEQAGHEGHSADGQH